MPATVDGDEFHLDLRAVAPEEVLDVKSAGDFRLEQVRGAGEIIEIGEILPDTPTTGPCRARTNRRT